MWTQESISIGLPNRLFVVLGKRKEKVALPKPPDEKVLSDIRKTITRQIENLYENDKHLNFDLTEEAKESWQNWYDNIPDSIHARRLDTIGLRLLALVCFITDKAFIDLEIVEIVKAILDYEFAIRKLTDPINADNIIARLEESIRRVLKANGSLKERELRRKIHAERYGLWAFGKAIENLIKAEDIKFERKGKSALYTFTAPDTCA